MGKSRYFLGMAETEWPCPRGSMFVISYKKQVFLGANQKIFPSSWESSSEIYEDAGHYQRLIEKLIYLTVTRSYISYVIDLSQFMHELNIVHWQGTLHVLTYIKGTLCKGLIYKKNGHREVEAYSYSSYAGDKGDKKSTLGTLPLH